MKSLGERIITAMEVRDMTQSDLARKAGLSRAVVSNIVLGKTKNPTFDNVVKIASALDVSLEYLAGIKRKR